MCYEMNLRRVPAETLRRRKKMLLDLIEETLKPAIQENPREKIDDLGKRKLEQ